MEQKIVLSSEAVKDDNKIPQVMLQLDLNVL